jgi:dehydro coenzyme F420 reductase / coenzyme F420-0:L-glutamate ligase / coenzyme F420-1:gamma-L-glutamate ligase
VDDLPSAEQTLALMRRRRTARGHTGDAVPPEALASLLEAVRWSPSAANRQPWQIIVISDRELQRSLRAAFVEEAVERDPRYRVVTERQADLLLAPLVLAVCGDERTKGSYVNADELGGDVQEELFVLTMGAAIENLLLMATACGLASTWIARAARVPRVRELLGVPQWLRVVALVALGPGPSPGSSEHMRRPMAGKVHDNRFGGEADG